MVAPKSLFRAALPLPDDVTAGSIQGCRVAFKVTGSHSEVPSSPKEIQAYVATGPRIYSSRILLGGQGQSEVSTGKDELLMPHTLQEGAVGALSCLGSAAPVHHAEIQSISLRCSDAVSNSLSALASVDSWGTAQVRFLDGANVVRTSVVCAATDCGVYESGWSGVAFPTNPQDMLLGTARSHARAVELFSLETGGSVRCFHSAAMPSAMTFLPPVHGPNIVAVTEAHQLSVWDARAGNHCGCAHRSSVSLSGEPLYAIATPDGTPASSPLYAQSPETPSMQSSQATLKSSVGEVCNGSGSSENAMESSLAERPGVEKRSATERRDGGGSPRPSGAETCAGSSEYWIAVGGADRTVTVLDSRKWSPIDHWLGCVKYDITGIAFSKADPLCVYVAGLDQELVCGRWLEASADSAKHKVNSEGGVQIQPPRGGETRDRQDSHRQSTSSECSGGFDGASSGPEACPSGPSLSAALGADVQPGASPAHKPRPGQGPKPPPHTFAKSLKPTQRHFSFRGDSHWCGMSVGGGDVVVGWCQSKSLYVAHCS